MKMTNHSERGWKKRALCTAVAAACLAPVAAHADAFGDFDPEAMKEIEKFSALHTKPYDQAAYDELTSYHQTVEAGLIAVDEDSAKFGRFNGLGESGVYPVINFELGTGETYNSSQTGFWLAKGRDVGLDTVNLQAEFGRHGDWEAYVEYDQIPVFRNDDTVTIFRGAGSTNLTLPPEWTPAPGNVANDPPTYFGDVRDFDDLYTPGVLKDVDIRHDRKIIKVLAGKVIDNNWSMSGSYRHETKEGVKMTGVTMGLSGGNPRAFLLPEPIDTVTQQANATIAYTTGDLQLQLAYDLSLFTNNDEILMFSNPYNGLAAHDSDSWWSNGGEGGYSLPPSNQAHKIIATGGYSVTDTMRLSAELALGRMTQDEDFLAYTVNPNLVVTEPLPRDSLDGEINTTLVGLRLTDRPMSKLNWGLSFRYDDRDNKTPVDLFNYIRNDSQDQPTNLAGNSYRYNEPLSYQEIVYAADVGYAVTSDLNISGGLERQEVERTYSEVEESEENTLKLGARWRMTDTIHGSLKYAHGDRSGSDYNVFEVMHSGFTEEYVAANCTNMSLMQRCWEYHPNLRKYYLGDRERDKVNLSLTAMPTARLSIGFHATITNDDYSMNGAATDPAYTNDNGYWADTGNANADGDINATNQLGVRTAENGSYTVDLAFMANEGLNLYGFFTREKIATDYYGHQTQNSNNNPSAETSTTFGGDREWRIQTDDDYDTIGIGIKQSLMGNRLEVGADITRVMSTTSYTYTIGSGLTGAPLPDIEANQTTLSLYGKYMVNKDLSVSARYIYDKYDADEFGYDDVALNQMNNVLTMGDQTPNYKVQAFAVSARYRF